MRKPARAGEAGQGLGYVLVVSAVLLMFIIALVGVLTREMRWLVKSKRSAVSLHQADAVIDRALFALQKPGNWDALPSGAVPGYVQDVTYSDIPGVAYTVLIQPGNWTPYTPAMGLPSLWTPAGDPKLNRTVTVFLTMTATGDHRKLQAVVLKSSINSAIFSGGQIAFSGNADVNWGPVVSYSTASDSIVAGKNGSDHPIFLSKGGIQGLPGTMVNLQNEASACVAGISYDAGDTSADLGTIPPIQWDGLRTIAEGQGAWHYYSGPTASSSPYSSGDVCNLPATNKMTWPVWTKDSVLYFDTCTGVNYDPTSMTICTGACSGNAIGANVSFNSQVCGYGVLVVQGDMDNSGGGGCTQGLDGSVCLTPPSNCPKYSLTQNTCGACGSKTDVTYKSANIFWDGYVFIAGKMKESGNFGVYGTVYVGQPGAFGTGTVSIFYKTNNSAVGMLGQSVGVSYWMEKTAHPTDVFP